MTCVTNGSPRNLNWSIYTVHTTHNTHSTKPIYAQCTQETPYKQYDNVDKVHLKAWPRELTNEVLRLITDTGCPAL